MATTVGVNGRSSSTPQPSVPQQISAPEGVIIPPHDIRDIIEKTAGYVHRNGNAFEARIRESEKANTKFSFLNPADPYYPYYEWRLDEFRENRGGQPTSATPQAESTTAAVAAPAPAGPPEPPQFEFSFPMPPISAQDLDIIRATALFAARNGRSFTTTLAQRESRNYQFDFLRPNHSLYPYFSKLIEQYARVLNPSDKIKERLQENISNKYKVLDRAQMRADWQKYKEEETKKAAADAEAEKIAYAQIDWHDFVVVETIEFTPADEEVDLPPPMSLAELERASLEEKQMMSLHNETDRLAIEEAAPDYEEARPVEISVPAPPAPPGVSATVAQPTEESEEDRRIRERQEGLQKQKETKAAAVNPNRENIKVLPQGSTRRSARAKASQALMQECPLCHQHFSTAEFDAHIRIELLDPKWKDQKAKLEARNAVSNLTFDDVSTNMKRLASARADLFDLDGVPQTEEEASRTKRRH
ncbi:putative pre-mRNA splicing factor [Myxozyma melibiosi]|uniref:Pre-mRNA splicing factor n=1 Tax=Myxozyma melibiosi TaxID=54550 RepID=A0ABR1FC00_9ASCO